MEKQHPMTLAEHICQPRIRKTKKEFFEQINKIIDWRVIQALIRQYDQRTASSYGPGSYDGLILFKISLIQTWYALSDYEVEEQVNDRLSFSKFCGLALNTPCPDHSTISRFRSNMSQTKIYEKLLKKINNQLKKHHIMVEKGAIVDASIIESPLKPKGKSVYDIPTETKQKTQQSPLAKQTKASTDSQAAWVKKAGRLYYGYKKHVISNEEGLIVNLLTSPANVNEVGSLEKLLASSELPKKIAIKADKGYASKSNRALLKEQGYKDQILRKASSSKELSVWEKRFNKLIGKTRYKIERTFGSIKRWFKGGVARYSGLAKMHTQNLLESICYNLYRAPGIIVGNALHREHCA